MQKLPKLPKGREVKPLWIISVILFVVAAALLIDTNMPPLDVTGSTISAFPDGAVHKAYKGMTDGGMGLPMTALTGEEYLLLLNSDDKSVAVTTTSYTTYPVLRMEFKISELTEIDDIDSIYFQGEGWSKNNWGGPFIMAAVWNDVRGVWDTSSESTGDVWSHKKTEDSYLRFTLKENVKDYINDEGVLKIAIRGAPDSWGAYDSAMWIDKAYIIVSLKAVTPPPEPPTPDPTVCTPACSSGYYCDNGVCIQYPPTPDPTVCTPACSSGYYCDNGVCIREGVTPPPRTIPGQPVTSYCGNNECERHLGESYVNCPDDCPIAVCGDGTCEYPETPTTCPDDCPVYCGNAVCEASRGETYSTCPQDCQPYCGDGICSSNEDCKTCSKDCGVCSIGEGLGVYRYILAACLIIAGVLAYIFTKPEKKKGGK